MKRVMSILAKAGLVELSHEEQAALGVRETEDALTSAVPEAAGLAVPPPEEAVVDRMPAATIEGIDEGLAFEEIYAVAGVPSSPFPAERLLRLLDGLRAMDPGTRKTAVLAMDQADEAWQIADPILDAQRKIAVLESRKGSLDAHVASRAEQTALEIESEQSERERRATEIRRQISDLEQLLEREVTRSAQAIAGLEAELAATHEAAARETRRIDGEIDRLREIPLNFSPQADEP